MTTAYAPDLAPDLEPKVVHWQPPHPVGGPRAHLFGASAYVALGLVALGALALGVAAAGAFAAGRGSRGRFRVLDLDGLDIGRLRRRPF